jgi:hypothetical protein
MTPVDVWPVIPRGPGHHGLAGLGGPIGVGLAGTRCRRAESAPAGGRADRPGLTAARPARDRFGE